MSESEILYWFESIRLDKLCNKSSSRGAFVVCKMVVCTLREERMDLLKESSFTPRGTALFMNVMMRH